MRPQALQGQATADLDDIVSDNSEADPTLHSSEASIAATIQFVASL
jgi:hypothetical protein